MMDTIRPLPVISTVQVVHGKLKEQNGVIEEFDSWLWACMVDFVTVGRRKEMIFTFRDGTEIEV